MEAVETFTSSRTHTEVYQLGSCPPDDPQNSISESSRKPKARFEAYVMTGDLILNLSRTTHSPEFLPPQAKATKREAAALSNSLPNSPTDLVHNGRKTWETPPKSSANGGTLPAMEQSTPLSRNSRSEDTLMHYCKENPPASHLENEDVNFSVNNLLDSSAMTSQSSSTDRVLWTYNALTEEEIRRLEANQFWASSRPVVASPPKPPTGTAPDKASNQIQVPNSQTCQTTECVGSSSVPTTTSAEGVIASAAHSVSETSQEQKREVSNSLSERAEAADKPMDLPSNGACGDDDEEISTLVEDVGGVNQTMPTTVRAVASPPLSVSSEEESDVESLKSFHYSPKGVDLPSAVRLAKRLYLLDGFHKSDVCRHLSKNNDFSRAVAEEYLRQFPFEGLALDVALRQFLQAFCLYGESSERDRVLIHFSKRYLDCNPESFASQDAVHILTCALMLLNSDLHGKHVGTKKMTCSQFVKRLAGLNDGENFPADLLRRLYNAIKTQPLEWATDEGQRGPASEGVHAEAVAAAVSNPYLDIPVVARSAEYKRGYVMRKCCVDPNGKKTPFGKRSWRMFFAVVRDLCLYLYKDESSCRDTGGNANGGTLSRDSFAMGAGTMDSVGQPAAIIRLHHALATTAPDYTKKQNVFRLLPCDRSQYLIQTSDTKELCAWLDAINLAAASLSAPLLPAAVGSEQRFERPLYPSSITRLSLREQLRSHEDKLSALQKDLQDHRANVPAKGARSSVLSCYRDKEAFLQYEIVRYHVYVGALRPCLTVSVERDVPFVDTTIGEVDEHSDSGAASPDSSINSGDKYTEASREFDRERS